MLKIKKIPAIFLSLLLGGSLLSFLTACREEFHNKVSFGTFIDSTVRNIRNFDDVINKVNVTHEGFILAVYPTNGCSCWSDFQPLLNRFSSTKYVLTYSISATEVKQAENRYGFSYSESSPILYFVNENGAKKKIDYYGGSTSPFVSFDSFVALFEKYCDYPEIYLVDDAYLDNHLAGQNEKIVHYFRSSCGDCQDSFPHVIFPYVRNHSLDNKIWAYDLDPLKGTEYYQPIKDKWFLSNANDSTFGFDTGVVPTTQYYQNGVLRDMNVYFNDSIRKDGEHAYSISDTYYTETRMAALSYVDSEDEPLLNRNIPEEEISVYISPSTQEVYYSWKKDYARNYHAPLLNKFLDKYAK